MALTNLENFLSDYAGDVNGVRAKYKADPDGTLKGYSLSSSERSLVKRNDPHEIKDYMKDAYGAALSIDSIG